MPIPQRSLGGDAKDVRVGAIGHGLMLLTWKPEPHTPDDEAFESMIAALEAGANFWNSGEFYGQPDPNANLKLLARFFKKYPHLADKVVLSVKGGLKVGQLAPDSSEENLRRSIDRINEVLEGTKTVDLFEPARLDASRPIEDTIKILAKLQKEGKFKHISLSEVSAKTLKTALSITPIAAVEIELSPWSLEPEALEVVKVAEESNVAVIAYSPLGRGMLTGRLRSRADIPEGDWRLHMPRFSRENFTHNLELVDAIQKLANKKGVTSAQFVLAWLLRFSPVVIPIPGSSHKTRTHENIKGAEVQITEEDDKAIKDVLARFTTKGGRYPDAATPTLMV